MKKPAELETLGVDAVIGDYTDLGKLAKFWKYIFFNCPPSQLLPG